MDKFKKRKLTAMALAVLVGTTGMTAFAGAPAPSAKGFDAYCLMPAEKELKDGCGHEEDGPHEEGCYDYVYSVNEKYQDILKEAAADAGLSFDLDGDGELSEEELVAGISGIDGEKITAYADALYAAIGQTEPDVTTDTSVFGDMEDGYYLIASKAPATDGEDGNVSLMLKAVHGQTEDMEANVHVPAFSQKILLPKDNPYGDKIATPDNAIQVERDIKATGDDVDKSETPNIVGEDTMSGEEGTETDGDDTHYEEEKEPSVEDSDAYEETDAADIGAGDEVLFEAKLGMPECIEDLPNWGFNIHAELNGLKLTQEPKLFVNGREARIRGNAGDVSDGGPASGVIGINGAHLTVDGKDVEYDKDTVVSMRYACTLDEGHLSGGTGNVSEAWAEFMPDMADASKNMETVHDKNAVFTYQLGVDSVNSEHEALAGAGFSLYRQDGEDWAEIVMSGEKQEGQTSFLFAALDAGVYKLSETTIPAGCVKADDLVFEIRPEYTEDSEDPALASLGVYADDKLVSSGDEDALFTADMESGTVYTELISGVAAHMPSTGANTRIILAAGGIALLAAGGAVYAVYRKKSKKDAE